MKLDLHIHSERSCDSFMKAGKIIEIAKKIGLDGIAITDHNALP
ncbi:MAG: PHP domain-containing protein, partial [Candidatus Aenigmarchaeota archaeon]|nr:PHP domain-containing protein [Candidatus Aenigmarchaeota archaeon]